MTESREHLLISRIVDGDSSDHEWRELAGLAELEPKLWRELAETQRDHAALTRAMASAAAVADATPMPAHRGRSMVSGGRRFSAWSGWSVAALVAIVAMARVAQMSTAPSSGTNGPPQANLASFSSAADAYQAYLDKGQETGQVIGEVPARLLVESRPAPQGGGFEVVFVRQVLERTIVPDLYQLEGQNELGQPTLMRYRLPKRGSM